MDSYQRLDFSRNPLAECYIKEEPRSPDPTPPLMELQPDHSPYPGYCGSEYQPNVPVAPDTPFFVYYRPLIPLNFAPHQHYINQRPNDEHYVNLPRTEYDYTVSWNGYSASSATSASPASSASHVTNPLDLWRPYIDPHYVPGRSRPNQYYNDSVPGPSRYHNDSVPGPSRYHNDSVPGPSRYHNDSVPGPSRYHNDSVPGPSRYHNDSVPGPSRYYNDSVPGPSQYYNDSVPGPSRYYNDIHDEAARSFGLVPSVAPAPNQYVGPTIATGQPPVPWMPYSLRFQPPAAQHPENLLADLFNVDDTVYNNNEYRTYESNALRKIAIRNGGILTPSRPQMRRDFIRKKGETDEAYRKRRDQNNKAAKLSRDRRKEKEIRLAIKISYLKLLRKRMKRRLAKLHK